jgi:D-glycero-alpha-D-manno-heptose 1-phosphate guanylyltransferase
MENKVSKVTPLILCGGYGTRLKSVLQNSPKSLALVSGRPFLSFLLDQISGAGFSKVILCTGYKTEDIEAVFGTRYNRLVLKYSRESKPLGTGGALRLASSIVDSEWMLVMNGDSYLRTDLKAYVHWHFEHDAAASLLLARVSDSSRYGRVETNRENRVVSFSEKEAMQGEGWINAGIYLIRRSVFMNISEGMHCSLEKDLMPRLLKEGLHGVRSTGDFIDIGTPESYRLAGQFFSKV